MVRNENEMLGELKSLVKNSKEFCKGVEKDFKELGTELREVRDLDNVDKFYNEFSEIFYTLLPRLNSDRIEIPNEKLHADYRNKKDTSYQKVYFVGRDITQRYSRDSYGNGVVLRGKDLFNFIKKNDITPFIKGNVISVLDRKTKILKELKSIIKKHEVKDNYVDSYSRHKNKIFKVIKSKVLTIFENEEDKPILTEQRIEKINVNDNGAINLYIENKNVDKDSYYYSKEQGLFSSVFTIDFLSDFNNLNYNLVNLDFSNLNKIRVLKQFEKEIKGAYKELIKNIGANVKGRKDLMDELNKKFSARLTIAKI